MKKLLSLFILVFIGNSVNGQTLTTGAYSSSDMGYTYTVNVEQDGNTITVTEPNRVNSYRNNGGTTYVHTEQKYSHFYLRVATENSFYTGKQGGSEQRFTYAGGDSGNEEQTTSGMENCPLYDKYLNKAQTDDVEVQAWAFCGAAALAVCTYDDPKLYLEQIIKSLKSMMDDPSECPCADVISQTQWNSVTLD